MNSFAAPKLDDGGWAGLAKRGRDDELQEINLLRKHQDRDKKKAEKRHILLSTENISSRTEREGKL